MIVKHTQLKFRMNTQPRFFKVDVDDFNNFKGLIVADFHIGQFSHVEEDEKLTIINLDTFSKTAKQRTSK